MTIREVDLPKWLRAWLEEKGEALDELLSDIERAALEGLADGLEIASHLPPGPPTGRPTDPVGIASELFLGKLLRDAADRLREDSRSSKPPPWTPPHGTQTKPESVPESNIDRGHRQRLEIEAQKAFNDEIERLTRILDLAANASYEAENWDLEILPNQRLADLQELGFVSGDVVAQTWLLGDTLEHDLAPALSGAVDSITPADVAFGEMDMRYDDLRWVSDDVLEGLDRQRGRDERRRDAVGGGHLQGG